MQTRFIFVVTFCLVFAFFAPSLALAAGWVPLNSSTTSTLYGMDIYGDVMFAAGDSETIIVSENSGSTWSRRVSGTTNDLYDIAMLSGTKAVAVGSAGTILRTTDAWATWSRVTPSGVSEEEKSYGLRAVVFPSSSVGFAVGEYALVLKTTDGGASWSKIASPATGGAVVTLTGVASTSTSKLWVVGDAGTIATSANGGSSWTTQTSGTTKNLTAISFTDSTRGWVGGEDRTFVKTANGGTTWSAITISQLGSDEDVLDVSFSSSLLGILSGANGTLVQSSDGGQAWSSVSSYGSPVLRDVERLSSNEWWAVGSNGAVYRYDADSPSKPTSFDVEGDPDAVNDSTPTFTWVAADDEESAVDYYMFKMDSGSFSNIGNTTSSTYGTTLANAQHTASLYAVDRGGNASATATITFTIDADSVSKTSPTVSRITPTTAVKDKTVVFSTRVTDDGTIEECDLYVDGELEKGMTTQTDIAYTTFSFRSSGVHSLYARCTDDAGNKTSGKAIVLTVSAGSTHVNTGEIIKIGCEGDVYPNDPCTAVYYYGVDGKRHAFSTEDIFKSWFDDFDDLVILSASAMSEIPLGRNVTYRPGERLVKFSTRSVYAVSYGGILRPISNVQIASAIFGDNWVSLIQTVSDVFYGNYRIGSSIESSSDFSPDAARSATRTIDWTF